MNMSGVIVEIGLSPDGQVINVTATLAVFTCSATAVKIKQVVSAGSMNNKQSSNIVGFLSVILLGALINFMKK